MSFHDQIDEILRDTYPELKSVDFKSKLDNLKVEVDVAGSLKSTVFSISTDNGNLVPGLLEDVVKSEADSEVKTETDDSSPNEDDKSQDDVKAEEEVKEETSVEEEEKTAEDDQVKNLTEKLDKCFKDLMKFQELLEQQKVEDNQKLETFKTEVMDMIAGISKTSENQEKKIDAIINNTTADLSEDNKKSVEEDMSGYFSSL